MWPGVSAVDGLVWQYVQSHAACIAVAPTCLACAPTCGSLAAVWPSTPCGGAPSAVVPWQNLQSVCQFAVWQVLQLTGRGLAGSFSAQPVEWADAGSGARFRVSGRYLYELRSGRSSIEVARYRLPA